MDDNGNREAFPAAAERLFDRVVDEGAGEAAAISLSEALAECRSPIAITFAPHSLLSVAILVQLALKHPDVGQLSAAEGQMFLDRITPLFPPGVRRVIEQGEQPQWADVPE